MKRNVLYWHGTPVTVVTDDGVFPLGDDASLLSSGAPAEILERLGTVLRSGLPEEVRFDILKHRMRTENRPLTVASMLSQVLDLPGGFSISETDDLSGPLEEANAFYAPIPPLPDLARQVLARSDREGHHLGRSSLRRLSGTVRKRTAELHDLLREPERVREKMQTMPELPVFER